MYYVYWEDNGIMAGLCIKIKVSNIQPIMEQVKSKCAGLIVIPPWYINNAVIIKYKRYLTMPNAYNYHAPGSKSKRDRSFCASSASFFAFILM